MMQLLSLLKQLLKGELEIDLENGSFTYKGVRVVALPVVAVANSLKEVASLFGEASPILFERIGEGVGAAVKTSMGWKTGEEVLKEFSNIAKAGGFGRVHFKDGVLYMENLPLSIEEPALAAYMRGFLRGLCIELTELKISGNSLKGGVKAIC